MKKDQQLFKRRKKSFIRRETTMLCLPPHAIGDSRSINCYAGIELLGPKERTQLKGTRG
jgi:hypothetical protein